MTMQPSKKIKLNRNVFVIEGPVPKRRGSGLTGLKESDLTNVMSNVDTLKSDLAGPDPNNNTTTIHGDPPPLSETEVQRGPDHPTPLSTSPNQERKPLRGHVQHIVVSTPNLSCTMSRDITRTNDTRPARDGVPRLCCTQRQKTHTQSEFISNICSGEGLLVAYLPTVMVYLIYTAQSLTHSIEKWV